MESFTNYLKRIRFIPVFVLGFVFAGYGQGVDGVHVQPKKGQTYNQQQQDQTACYNMAYQQAQNGGGKHQTLKGAGIGAVAGAAVGTIFHKTGAGAAAGAAGGGLYGHRKAKKGSFDNKALKNKYCSCMRDKGYAVTRD